MEKKYAFILSFILTGLIASNLYLFSSFFKNNEQEQAIVARVIDGDTLQLQDSRIIRLVNINSPEKNSYGYNLSLHFLKSFENQSLDIEILGKDKYNRNLARLYNQDYINMEIVSLGFASKFLVQKDELKAFAEAESNAIENERGIWKKSPYFSCFSTDINKNNEYVTLTNNCSTINMNLWILKDESRKTFKFKNFVFQNNSKIAIYSTSGKDNITALFWQSKDDIWNNDRDSLYLFDNNGGLAHYEAYGY